MMMSSSLFQTRDTTRRLFLRTMSRKGSWDDDGSSLSESLLRFVHGGDEANPPTPRSVTQALALTPATRERRNSDLDELTFYYSPEEPGVRGEVRVGLDRSVDRYDEDEDEDALVDGGGASFASWRDVPRRLEEVEGSVEDVRRRLLALELHGRRRAREDSANVAVGLPGPRMRACLQTASLTCLRLNRPVDWNLAPPPSPPASTYSQTYSHTYSQTDPPTEATSFSCTAVARPPEIIALFASRIAQHVESNDPAPSHVASCAHYAAYHAARSIRARVDRVFASMSSDSESDQSRVSTSASDGRCETGSASGAPRRRRSAERNERGGCCIDRGGGRSSSTLGIGRAPRTTRRRRDGTTTTRGGGSSSARTGRSGDY